MNRSPSPAVLALSLATALAPGGVRAADPPVFPGRSEIAQPPMPIKDSTGLTYTGTVTEVTKDSITIRWPGEEKPKTFAASETLAAGSFPKQGRPRFDGTRPSVAPWHQYRLADVKIGDHIDIGFAHLNGVSTCDSISIRKRPGGRVPPLPDGAENLKPRVPLPPNMAHLFIPYHERMNAYWDLEEKGIPYPEKFGPARRWPEAPMPRPVGVAPAVSPAIAP